MCTKEIIEKMWAYIQGKGVFQKPQNTLSTIKKITLQMIQMDVDTRYLNIYMYFKNC